MRIEKDGESVNRVQSQRPGRDPNASSRGRGNYSRGLGSKSRGRGAQSREKHDAKKCFQCGYDYQHVGKCPAIGKNCTKCVGKDHFTRVCPKQKGDNRVQQLNVKQNVERCSSSDDDYIFKVNEHKTSSKHPYVNVKLGTDSFDMLDDTGATVNFIGSTAY